MEWHLLMLKLIRFLCIHNFRCILQSMISPFYIWSSLFHLVVSEIFSIVFWRHPTTFIDPPLQLSKKKFIIFLTRTSHIFYNSEYLHPICITNGAKGLKSDSMYYDNPTTYVIGDGKYLEDGELSTALRDSAIHLVDTDTCTKNYKGYRVVIDDRVLCAGGNGSDSCYVSDST